MIRVLFAHDPAAATPWREAFERLAPQVEFRVWQAGAPVDDADYLITWKPPSGLLAQLPSLKAIFLLSAGADHLMDQHLPQGVDIVRMSEPGLVKGMIQYVSFAVQGIHRGLFECARNAREGAWVRQRLMPPDGRTVGVMGLGALGSAVMLDLQSQGFAMRGWSNSAKQFAGVETFAGTDGFGEFLAGTEILICLVALTPQTRGILGHDAMSKLPEGAAIINVARGGIVNEQELMELLDEGHLSQAVLDVFETEPLPTDNPLWRHPRVFVTPHIASVFQPETATEAVVKDLLLHASGGRPATTVDRNRGY
ncbi:MAG: glyoxylate/hydroxypyruvate reductase A [Mesorhizobium sp.]